jgi:hypothetical protein
MASRGKKKQKRGLFVCFILNFYSIYPEIDHNSKYTLNNVQCSPAPSSDTSSTRKKERKKTWKKRERRKVLAHNFYLFILIWQENRRPEGFSEG